MKKPTYIITILILLSLTNIAQTDSDNPNRQHINEDLFVTGSLGIGNDMYDGYSFGYNTFALAENNIRILFDDNSSTGSAPNNDWRIVINGADNGGDNYFDIHDFTGGTVPFRIMAAAPNHSIFIEENNGNIGFRTSAPEKDFHIKSTNTPTIRFEQDNSGGWTPQTWELGGGYDYFFIRDITHSNSEPFKIESGAPSYSLTVLSSGNVGLGLGYQQSHDHKLEVNGDLQLNDYFYFGENSTDGNWRMGIDNGNFIFQKRESGVWVTKLEMK